MSTRSHSRSVMAAFGSLVLALAWLSFITIAARAAAPRPAPKFYDDDPLSRAPTHRMPRRSSRERFH